MRRAQLALLIAAAAIALLLIAVFGISGQNPLRAAPLQQVTNELEPNDGCSLANPITLALAVQGAISPVTDTDWFSVTTQTGLPYVASASVGPADFSVRICIYAYNGSCQYMGCSSPSSSYVEETWTATGDTHFIEVERYGAALITHTASYALGVVQEYVPPATNTPTATPPSTPVPANADAYETNDSMGTAYVLPVATSIELESVAGLATFHDATDSNNGDWFRVWVKDGKWYQATTSELSGVDTKLRVYDQNGNKITSDDDGAGGLASEIVWEGRVDNYYYIQVTNKAGTGSYNLEIQESDVPMPTSIPADTQADGCEDNHDFDHACIIAADKSYDFNLVPVYGSGPDNDYYKLWVKPGYIYECATSNLSPGVDPNMIMYDQNQNGFAGNDDVAEGDLNSKLSYYATYEGWLYVLLGTGDRTPSDIYDSEYTLLCERKTPGQISTPTPTPTKTPRPGVTSPPPAPTEKPAPGLTVRPLVTPTPGQAAPGTEPPSSSTAVEVLIYYDVNDDQQPGAGEGIKGISAQAYEASSNKLLVEGFSDEQGHLEFTVWSKGPVLVSMPFFGFSQLVAGEEATIYLRVPPSALPGESP